MKQQSGRGDIHMTLKHLSGFRRKALAHGIALAFGAMLAGNAQAAAPLISTYSPADNAVNASTSGSLVVTFDQTVTAVAGKNIVLRKSDDDSVVETIAASDTARVSVYGSAVYISPAASRQFTTGYYVQIDNGAFQNSGSESYGGIANTTTWNFTTLDGASLTSTTPASGATNFSEADNLVMNLSENVTAVAGRNIKIYLQDGTLQESIAANDTSKVSISKGSVTINPVANLAAGGYYVLVDPGAFTGNSSGAPYAGISDSGTWAFSAVVDTTAPTPSFWGFSPSDNATNANLNDKLVIYFSEPIVAVTGKNVVLKKSADNSVVETIAADDTGKVVISGTTATVTPSASFAASTGYYVQIDSGAFRDKATTPNNYVGISDTTTWNFSTQAGASIVSTGFALSGAPIPLAPGSIPENAQHTLTFNEPVTAVGGKNLTFKKTSDNSIAYSVDVSDPSVSLSGRTATITLSSPLSPDTYYVNLDAGAFTGNLSAAASAAIADTTTWIFTTVADVTAPTASFYPANNATNVAITSKLSLYFSEPISAVAGKNVVLKKSSDNSVVETIVANDTGKVAISSTTATITPSASLTANTGYYIQIDSGAFRDMATTPNNYAGISNTITWQFTTAAGAKIIALNPTDDATGVSPTQPQNIVFNEAVSAVAGKNVVIKKASDNSVVETIAANDTSKVSISKSSVTVTRTTALAVGTGYYVEMDAGAFTGVSSGSSSDAISGNAAWNFTTSNGANMYAFTPADNATGVGLNATYYIFFNEAVTAVAGKNITIKKSADNSVVETIVATDPIKVGRGVYSSGTGWVGFRPSTGLALNTGYYIEVDAGAFSGSSGASSAALSGATTWNFTTTSTLGLTQLSPANGAANIYETTALTTGFTEPTTAVAGKNLVIRKSADDSIVETIAVTDTTKIFSSANSLSRMIVPATNLAAGGYYVLIDSGAFTGNVSGASYGGIADKTIWAFTTVADATAPVFLPYSPAINATGVSATPTFTAFFAKNVSAVAGKNLYLKKSSDNSVVATVAANDTAKVAIQMNGRIVTVNPGVTLDYSTGYYINAEAGAFRDNAATPNSSSALTNSTDWRFTTVAAPVVSAPVVPVPGSTDVTPPPSSTTVPSGGTGSITSAGMTLTANSGSTLLIDKNSNVSGATVNLPQPSTTGASVVNVSVGGQNVSIQPTLNDSRLTVVTATVNGSSTPVMSVSAGRVVASATVANQPMIAVGTINPVVVISNTAQAKATASLDASGRGTITVSGGVTVFVPGNALGTGTDLQLIKPSNSSNDPGQASTASVTLQFDKTSLKIVALSDEAKLKLKRVPINCKQTTTPVTVTLPILVGGGGEAKPVPTPQPGDCEEQTLPELSNGNVQVSAQTSGQPMMSTSGGNSTIMSSSSNATLIAKSDQNSGNTRVSVTSGSVILPGGQGNAFTALREGRIFVGETAEIAGDSSIARVWLGSAEGGAVGDPITVPNAPGLDVQTIIPNLNGYSQRIDPKKGLSEVVGETLATAFGGVKFQVGKQNEWGVIQIAAPQIGQIIALPVGKVSVDTNRPDGVSVITDGEQGPGRQRIQVVNNGVVMTFVPAMNNPVQIVENIVGSKLKTSIVLNDFGIIRLTTPQGEYLAQSAWTLDKVAADTPHGFQQNNYGALIFTDKSGTSQKFWPAFADMPQLIRAFRTEDPMIEIRDIGNGAYYTKFREQEYTLIPGWNLLPLPGNHTKDLWWVGDDGSIYIKNSDGKTAQGFSVK